MLQTLISTLRGPPAALMAHRRALSQHRGIAGGIEELQRHCAPIGDDSEEPIFLLSAGWRSGSTLLQRLIMSDADVMVWGEPYDECGLIQALAETTKAFRTQWPPAEYFYDGTPPANLSDQWIANLFPALEDLRRGHRAFLDATFGEPARRAGAQRWGIKEVRLDIEHGFYLQWLYPKARFIFLYRNPLDAYRSYSRYGRNWYDVFPDRPIFTPAAFGSHWRQLMDGFLRDAGRLGAMLVRYEDLVGDNPPLDTIEGYLGIRMNRAVLGTKVGSSERKGEMASVNRLEKWLLRRAVSPIAEQLGYQW